MSVFKKGYNKVDRRVVIPALTEAFSFDIPAGEPRTVEDEQSPVPVSERVTGEIWKYWIFLI